MSTRPPVSIDLFDALRGRRVLVRPFRAADAPAVWAAIEESREHLAKWMPWVQHLWSLADERAALAGVRARWRTREDLTVGIFDRRTGALLGGTGLHRINWALRVFEIGYWIRRTAEGSGYVTEAVALLVRYAFDRLGAHRVEIRMDPRNVRSRRVPERLGFVFEGILRRSAPDVHGAPSDRCIFALIREDYLRLAWAGGRRSAAPGVSATRAPARRGRAAPTTRTRRSPPASSGRSARRRPRT